MTSTNHIVGPGVKALAGLRAVCYARTARSEQSHTGTSGCLHLQLEAAREAAAAHGFTLVHLFSDNRIGGAQLHPAFESCMTCLRSGGADALVVHSIDRIDRDINRVIARINELCHVGVTTVVLREMLIISQPDDVIRSTLLNPMGGIGRNGRVSRS